MARPEPSAAENVRFRLPLATDTSLLTAIANDYGYDEVYARQVRAFGRPGSVLVAMSTSGDSPNVVQAVEAARAQGLPTIGMTAASGGQLAEICDVCLRIPTIVTARAQEMHMLIGHTLCEYLEDALTNA